MGTVMLVVSLCVSGAILLLLACMPLGRNMRLVRVNSCCLVSRTQQFGILWGRRDQARSHFTPPYVALHERLTVAHESQDNESQVRNARIQAQYLNGE